MLVVDAQGHRGGLALLWMDTVTVDIVNFSLNHIDARVTLDVGGSQWRFTGFYGLPECQRCRESWDMLRNLSGFRNAVADSGLMDFPFSGNQFTWERSRGTPAMVEEKLDRVLVTETWLSLFEGAKACSLICPYSDHLPIMITPEMSNIGCRSRRFCFDNMWLKETTCREIVEHSWDKTMGMDVITRIAVCSQDIWRWGREYNRDFLRKIEWTKAKLELLRSRRDPVGVADYARTERDLLILIEQQHLYWKQRAKEH
ncbi:uncharacterized protein LOC116033319 [Ipomoea triloba]|uniref:uncharacterized protein LOC116033319 n=1 Tax=Ipomoea triloba TaxID=35885 RepID=UPI00125D8F94|nr:uncharacterized protein LOC116033319 [Ipomoea triloba]